MLSDAMEHTYWMLKSDHDLTREFAEYRAKQSHGSVDNFIKAVEGNNILEINNDKSD